MTLCCSNASRRCARFVAAGVIAATLCVAGPIKPAEALERYLAGAQRQADCSGSVYSVNIDASMPALRKRGSMTGSKWIIRPGQAVYRGLHFSGDNFIKTQVIARFLARDSNSPAPVGDTGVTPLNYTFRFDRASGYNGLEAYVYLVKPRHKRTGLLRGELWLDAETAAPLRLWGDVVKSPSILIRSLRFVEDYQPPQLCIAPLRLLLMARTRIAGTVEMTVWLHPVSCGSEAAGGNECTSGLQYGGQTGQ